MINGIIKNGNGFSVKDFQNCKILFDIDDLNFDSYEDAVKECRGKYYPDSFYPYLMQAAEFDFEPTDYTWENMIHDGDPRGVWDGRMKEWRSSRSMMHGAATEDEVAYLDALCFTYESLMAMVK